MRGWFDLGIGEGRKEQRRERRWEGMRGGNGGSGTRAGSIGSTRRTDHRSVSQKKSSPVDMWSQNTDTEKKPLICDGGGGDMFFSIQSMNVVASSLC